ncbi:MAG: thioredoxin [Chloroflexi bacterium]|nr:thioredoxin [Chloroflexota bacterium]
MAETTPAPIHVNDADFKETILNAAQPAVVDFWAAWCGPCRMIAPSVEELAREYAGKAVVAKLDADMNPQTIMQYGVMGIPTLIFFKGGKEVDRLVGAYPKAAIVKKLDAVLAK